MYKILLIFWSKGELGILLSRFTDLYQYDAKSWYINDSVQLFFFFRGPLENLETNTAELDSMYRYASTSAGNQRDNQYNTFLGRPKVKIIDQNHCEILTYNQLAEKVHRQVFKSIIYEHNSRSVGTRGGGGDQ